MLFCGIDTSNYTTSAALCDESGRVLANIKEPLPVRAGECGLRQSDAVFAHTRNLPTVTARLRDVLASSELCGERLAAFGVSERPRDAEGSYMPCFLAGVAAASAAADAMGLPIYRTSHQNGHIMAALYSSGMTELVSRRHIAFHVSGGTTEVLLSEPRDSAFAVTLIGGTRDLNAGQAVDRTGVMLGLRFPCGAALEELANGSDRVFGFPRVAVRDGWCNLSGLQNKTQKMLSDGESPSDIAAFLFDHIAAVLFAMASDARAARGELPIVFAGGVMSNKRIRSRLEALGNVYFAAPEFSADNAAGVALLCRRRFLNELDGAVNG